MELIYVTNGTSTSVSPSSIIPTTAIIHHRKASCSCGQAFADNATPTILKSGYYKVSGFVSFTSTAGTASVAVAKGATTIQSSTASLTAEASTTYSLPIDTMVLVRSGEAPTTITLVNGATTLTVERASLTVEKVA